MKVIDIIKNAETIQIVHAYDDGTYLFDILCDGEAYVIRQQLSTVLKYEKV